MKDVTGYHFRTIGRLGGSLVLFCLLGACADVKDAYMVDSVIRPPNSAPLASSGWFGLNQAQYVPEPFDVYTQPFPGDTDVTKGAPNATPDKRHNASTCKPPELSVSDKSPGWTTNGFDCRPAYAFAKDPAPSVPAAPSTATGQPASSTGSTETATTTSKPDPAVANRDALMMFLIQNSDDICHTHEAGIIADSSTANFGFSETATILSSLGAIVTGAATVRALSGAAAAVNATRDNFNNVFYQNLLAAAIIKSIEATRTTKRGVMLQHSGHDEDYSVDRMLSDLVDYHESCSFYQGLVSLTSAAARSQSSAEELSARIASLEAKIRENGTTIANLGSGNSTAVAKLTAANAQMAAEIAQLEYQLSMVPSSTASPAPTNSPATAPAQGSTAPPPH